MRQMAASGKSLSSTSLGTFWLLICLIIGLVPSPLEQGHFCEDVDRARLVDAIVEKECSERDHCAVAKSRVLLAQLRVHQMLGASGQIISLLVAYEAHAPQAKIC